MLYESTAVMNGRRHSHDLENKVFRKYFSRKRDEINQFFIIKKKRSIACNLFCCKARRKRTEQSRSRENTPLRLVFPLHSVLYSLPACFIQNRSQARFLYCVDVGDASEWLGVLFVCMFQARELEKRGRQSVPNLRVTIASSTASGCFSPF